MRNMVKPKLRGNGRGSVYRVADPKRALPWVASVTVGWTLAGNPVRRNRFFGSKAEAETGLRDLLDSLDTGRRVHDPRLTIRAWLPAWIEHRTDLRPATVRVWRTAADHVLRRLGTIRVRELGPMQIEAALAEMPPGIAPVARALLSSALRDAEREGMVERNAAKIARAPKVVRQVRHVPTAAEARALIAAAPQHPLGALIVTALGTGLRQGELLGLTRDHLDLDAGTADVRWQLATRGGFALVRPKTAESIRTVELPPFVIAALRAHLASQAADQLAAGPKWGNVDRLVFTRPNGQPLTDNAARTVLDELCELAGVPRVHFHSLRATALTLITEGAGQKAAQTVAGHTNIATTDIYAKGTDELRHRAAVALQEAIG